MSLLCFLSLAGVRCFAVLRLVKHDSLFSLDTKPIIWTFVDRREKSSFTKDRNRHFEGCGKRGCGGSMKSIQHGNVCFLVICSVSVWFAEYPKMACIMLQTATKDAPKNRDYGWAGVVCVPCYITVACVRVAWRAVAVAEVWSSF